MYEAPYKGGGGYDKVKTIYLGYISFFRTDVDATTHRHEGRRTLRTWRNFKEFK